jgi:hypothetical protein
MNPRAEARLCCAVVVLVMSGCTRSSSEARPVRIEHFPPNSKDLIEAALRSSDVPLSVDPSCKNVGSDFDDKTIGRYVSGLLAQQSEPKGSNWIQTTAESVRDGSGVDVWQCRIMIRHVDGDDRWGWGVQFSVRQRDGFVLRDSFKCIGGG